ncbi:MAG: GNAT family N-acetyltransferase [Elusimicrobia bacterium]|nr:GNAT family N-acetyltransferase [Elusimicrobiota bacterium]
MLTLIAKSHPMKVLNSVPFALWDSISEQCEYATFFHTSAWSRILLRSHPHSCQIKTRAFLFDGRDWVVLPSMGVEHECKGFFKAYHSNMLGVYGGFVAAPGVLTEERVQRIVEFLERDVRAKEVLIFGNPYCDQPISSRNWDKKPDFTQVLDLSAISEENQLLEKYDQNVRRLIRKAEKTGLRVTTATRMEEIDRYYAVYQESLRRWGEDATSRYEPPLFQSLFKQGGDKIRFWLVWAGERLLGGSVNLYHSRYCISWHCVYSDHSFEMGAPKFLNHKIMMDAKKRGVAYFDFNPSGGHEGVVQHKEKFGSHRLNFSVYRLNNNRFYRSFSMIRNALTLHGATSN